MRNIYTGTSITSSFEIATDPTLLSVTDFELNDIVLYPNPVVNELFINAEVSKIETVEIYTINGQLVKSETIEASTETKVDVSSLPSGMYLIKLISDNGSIYKRIIK